MDRKEIKSKAKEFAFKNKWKIWKPLLIIVGISAVVGIVLEILGYGPKTVQVGFNQNSFIFYKTQTNPTYDVVESILGIALLPLIIGVMYYIMNLIKGKELDIKEVFSKYKYFLPIFIVTLLCGLFTALWTVLLIIPGIIYAIKIAMVPYLMAEEVNENTKFKEITLKSKKMMEGHKWEYVVFNLSFIGWILLSFVTFGIALIWVIPYIQTANIMYYEKLKELN